MFCCVCVCSVMPLTCRCAAFCCAMPFFVLLYRTVLSCPVLCCPPCPVLSGPARSHPIPFMSYCILRSHDTLLNEAFAPFVRTDRHRQAWPPCPARLPRARVPSYPPARLIGLANVFFLFVCFLVCSMSFNSDH